MEKITLIDYQGSIRYETIGELIHKLKQQVTRFGMPVSIYKRILLIMIESLENMMKHGAIPGNQYHACNLPAVTIIYSDNRYIMQTSNPLHVKHIPPLKAKIDFLNKLDQEGLKHYYKETITDGVFTQSGGAGLGLIEIARISGKPIHYEFQPLDEEYTCYRQQITIDVK